MNYWNCYHTTGNKLITPTKKIVTLQKVTTLSFVYATGSLSEGYCSECCTNNVFYSCLGELGDTEAAVSECEKRNASCVQSCKDSRSLPLGSSLLLLPFALVYALVRKRKEETL